MEKGDYENKEYKPKAKKKAPAKKAAKKEQAPKKEPAKKAAAKKLDASAKYVVVGTGKGNLPQGREYTVSGQVAELLVSKGHAKLK